MKSVQFKRNSERISCFGGVLIIISRMTEQTFMTRISFTTFERWPLYKIDFIVDKIDGLNIRTY